jgi:hypothetical protein
MKVPKKVQTDQGTEFYNTDIKRLFKELGVIHFSTDQELKASMVERFNRTLRDKIKKYLTAKETKHYVSALPDLVKAYNRSPHSSLDGLAPIEVTKKNEKRVYDILYGDYLREKKKRQHFKVNDIVRVTNVRKTFMKKMVDFNFSHELFQVINIIDSIPPTYQLKRLSDDELVTGAYYHEQLQKVNIDK